MAFDRLSPRGREDAAGKCGCCVVTSSSLASSLPRFLAPLLTAVSLTNKAAYRYPLLLVSISRPSSEWEPLLSCLGHDRATRAQWDETLSWAPKCLGAARLVLRRRWIMPRCYDTQLPLSQGLMLF